MTDLEFDILDELYFVTSYAELQKKTMLDANLLSQNLIQLIKIEYVNYFLLADGVQNPTIDLNTSISKLYFLASKKGLFAHNSK
ncbi:MAG: hypothetical protein EAZ53_12425 [Bacteroidetes bacterium]|nr:MAG: hypothetical protein EAZ53_12425 [Bacteroidota bacterium]